MPKHGPRVPAAHTIRKAVDLLAQLPPLAAATAVEALIDHLDTLAGCPDDEDGNQDRCECLDDHLGSTVADVVARRHHQAGCPEDAEDDTDPEEDDPHGDHRHDVDYEPGLGWPNLVTAFIDRAPVCRPDTSDLEQGDEDDEPSMPGDDGHDRLDPADGHGLEGHVTRWGRIRLSGLMFVVYGQVLPSGMRRVSAGLVGRGMGVEVALASDATPAVALARINQEVRWYLATLRREARRPSR